MERQLCVHLQALGETGGHGFRVLCVPKGIKTYWGGNV
jgi:hypothetical protein